MDYVQMIEQYVLEAWAEGKTTQEIKRELGGRRWPREMVEVVIDRLVKQRVVRKDGQMLELNGPDYWNAPTWQPPQKGWARKIKSQVKAVMAATEVAPGGAGPAWLVTRVPDEVMRPAQVAADAPSVVKPEVRKGEVAVILPLEIPNPAVALVPKRIDQALAKMRAKSCPPDKKLRQKMARLQQEQEKLEAKQAQAMWLILLLIGVIILAALWRIFVIK